MRNAESPNGFRSEHCYDGQRATHSPTTTELFHASNRHKRHTTKNHLTLMADTEVWDRDFLFSC